MLFRSGQLRRRPSLRALAGRDVAIGLRPQAMAVDTDPTADAARVTVTPAAVEHLGSEKNVLFAPPFDVPDVGVDKADAELAAMWTAHVDADTDVRIGAPVTLRLDLNRAYLFDAATGLAVPTVDAVVGAAV